MKENSKKYININEFVKEYNLSFKSEKSKINWFKKLKSETLYRIGESWFISKIEFEKLFEGYAENQIAIKRNRIDAFRSKNERTK